MYSNVKELMPDFTWTYSTELDDGLQQLSLHPYDLVIMDLQLVEKTYEIELLQSLRRAYAIPIIVLSDYTKDEDIAHILHTGIDSHFSKPVSATILEAQASALICRYASVNFTNHKTVQNGVLFRNGDFAIDYAQRIIYQHGSPLKLSAQEYRFLHFFIENSGRVLTGKQICEYVWKSEKDYYSNLSVPIKRIRQKIEPDSHNPIHLRSIRGMGYRFDAEPVE